MTNGIIQGTVPIFTLYLFDPPITIDDNRIISYCNLKLLYKEDMQKWKFTLKWYICWTIVCDSEYIFLPLMFINTTDTIHPVPSTYIFQHFSQSLAVCSSQGSMWHYLTTSRPREDRQSEEVYAIRCATCISEAVFRPIYLQKMLTKTFTTCICVFLEIVSKPNMKKASTSA